MLHNKVKLKRAEHELTQSDVAAMVDVTRQTIAFVEKGEFAPSVTLALRLARALKTPIHELFWITEDN